MIVERFELPVHELTQFVRFWDVRLRNGSQFRHGMVAGVNLVFRSVDLDGDFALRFPVGLPAFGMFFVHVAGLV